MPRRLVICCDGTWNRPDQADEGQIRPTNVTRLALALCPRDRENREQLLFYSAGVGTRPFERFRGGAFGLGLSRNVLEAYVFLAQNYQANDQLYLFGFSRGAYTVRSTVGLVRQCGLLKPEYLHRLPQAYELYRRRDRASHPRENEAALFRRAFSREVRVRFLGVWDTVGALGIPFPMFRLLNHRWEFHDVTLSSIVEHACQALAIDERRRPFQPAVWQQQDWARDRGQIVEQVWFAGVHSDVGGGYLASGLSDIALLWMVDAARRCGLAFDLAALSAREQKIEVRPDPLGPLHNSRRGVYRLWPRYTRPLGDAPRSGEREAGRTNEAVHESALVRMQAGFSPPYAPQNLIRFLESGGPVVRTDESARGQALQSSILPSA